ncbi:Ankyrin repeat domain containing protein [Pandoravirus salinus]|uniref:Ankyrin repeat domain containing protein n=1 Tax=Pandoravirus salinus TaxID=1349410 RepID=S4W431_9VIRU|nr:ankyrin repeat domain [Pandoravirus salinus]AGO85070.1 Ankyrin repeat domain containing protein [Pandoravirus salinus]
MITAMPSEIAARVLDYLNDVDFCAARLAHRWFLVHTDDEITQQRRLAVWRTRDLDLCRKGDTTAVAALAAAGHYFTRVHLGEAALHGRTELIDLLLSDAVPHTRYSPGAMKYAAGAGHLDTVIHLHRVAAGRHEPAAADGRIRSTPMDHAAGKGHLDIVKWLHENTDQGCTTWAMDMAAANGHTEVLQWLHEHGTKGCTARAGSTSCAGNAQTVAWIFAHLPQALLDPLRVFQCAAALGHIDVLQWLHANGLVPAYSSLMAESAAGHGRLDVLQWMTTHLADAQFDASVTQAAALEGHLGVVEWLCDNYTDAQPTSHVLTAALNGGHMHIVDFICARQPDLAVLNTAMDTAVTRGCFEAMGRGDARNCFDALEWMRVNRPAVAPTRSGMDMAIFAGRLDVAQWLHRHYGTDCSPHSMDSAAATGRVDLIGWLWRTYGHACTIDFLDAAAGGGHVAVLDWLRSHFSRLAPTAHTVSRAAKGGFIEVLRWLHRNHPDLHPGRGALEAAITHGHLSVVQFLCETYALEIDEALVTRADRNQHFAVVDYLRSRCAIGPAVSLDAAPPA